MPSPPQWDDPVWADRTEHFDFATGHWTAEGPFLAIRKREESSWQMPPESHWNESPVVAGETLERRLTKNPLFFISVIGGFVAVLAVRFGWPPSDTFSEWAAPLIALSAVLVVVSSTVSTRRIQREGALRQVEDQKEVEVAPVVLEILQSGIVTGVDQGVAWIENDGLYFTGEACSFVIGKCDVHPIPAWRLEERIAKIHRSNLLFLQHKDRTIALQFVDALTGNAVSEEMSPATARFLTQMKSFRLAQGGPEQRSYPPLSIQPKLTVPRVPISDRPLLVCSAATYLFALFAFSGISLPAAVLIGIAGGAVFPLYAGRYPDRRLLQVNKLIEASRNSD